MNKVTSLTIISSVLILSIASVMCFTINSRKDYVTEHKYNRCLAISMSESRQSGQVIDIDKAKSICDGLQGR